MRYQNPPIALLQLRSQKPQTLAAIASIAFVTLLLFMQIGFRAAFLDALLVLPRSLQGDLFLFSSSTITSIRALKFSERRLYQMLAFDEVEQVIPLYLQPAEAHDPSGKPGFLTRILVIGFPLAKTPFTIPEVNDKLHLLKEGGVFLIDQRSRSEFKPIIHQVEKQGKIDLSIIGGIGAARISVKGLFPLGMNDAIYSHMLTSDETFMDVFETPREYIHIGVIQLKSGVDVNAVQQKIMHSLTPDVVIKQKHEMLRMDREVFEFKTPLGMVFRIGIIISVVIGIVVLYQILFQLTSKYLRDYATLKALGFSHGMLLLIVLAQALILAVIGYVLGWFISGYFYKYMTGITNMKFNMTLLVMAAVFALVCFICLISALLAIRKLNEADPADLFG